MARLEDIRGLAEAHASSISSSPRDWMNYLDTAARLYRYPFMDQLLIHAQRPQATACASLELWNQKMFRWVNRGAKGIALIDETTQKTRLRYVFDVQDTHMVNGGRTPYLWKLQEEQQEEVLLHLEEVYGLEAKDTKNLSDALMATARYMVEENLEEYLDGLLYVTEGTYLEELEEDTIRSEFRSLLTDSIYYTLASRCGLDPMERQEEMDFVHITDYNRLSVLTSEELAEMITTETPTDTRIMSISVTDDDPKEAKQIADTLRKAVSVQITEIMNADSVNTVEEGNLPTSPSSPNVKKNMMLGALLGLVISMGFVVLISILDDTVKTPDDVEKYLGLNVLTSIPIQEGSSAPKRAKQQRESRNAVKSRR